MTIFSACSFGLPERGTENSTVCVHKIHTRSVHSLLTSTDHTCACGSSRQGFSCIVSSLRASKNLSSGQPCHLRAGLCLTFSLPIHQDDTVHRAPLPAPLQSISSADESFSNVNFERRNPRNTSPTFCDNS